MYNVNKLHQRLLQLFQSFSTIRIRRLLKDVLLLFKIIHYKSILFREHFTLRRLNRLPLSLVQKNSYLTINQALRHKLCHKTKLQAQLTENIYFTSYTRFFLFSSIPGNSTKKNVPNQFSVNKRILLWHFLHIFS
jgi:hypothetical protein